MRKRVSEQYPPSPHSHCAGLPVDILQSRRHLIRQGTRRGDASDGLLGRSQKREAEELKGFWLILKAVSALSHELYHVL